ncbi:MAG: hypothetical protein DKM50_07455 [Candidatus Margulisiibacteriota bacterium]|nr:MAG: hypothetical protein A2X43_05980 [Candidatus Margulisbacteria bacterium GWD2_39_127]OGI02672.1 MAG: hypothetical protein A2X42_00305 [Candidatus Margulisbacteria bacterium GWF2_38_17]OGI05943.1 MAG: hypothetical protein A2X41_07680 [Candidatus Margulisbacteria bacterium GWE2_39_32]PZM80003.1 MAG: hypothetical protein DKM50_07455 [Candidatus Margulisiibacteriota bacterium]HAR62592.1 hypothetical protein [Candidatus Margulisiibacteriota bacterium]
MSQKLQCKIWSLKEKLFEGEIDSITYPNIDLGPTTILKDHIATVGLIKKGKLKYQANDELQSLEVSKGIIHVEKNQVVVLLMPS